jgi:hypothetical protein
MARMGNWRDNKDDEIQLDGIGGVNIMVKADVHRSGKNKIISLLQDTANINHLQRHQFPLLCLRKPS